MNNEDDCRIAAHSNEFAELRRQIATRNQTIRALEEQLLKKHETRAHQEQQRASSQEQSVGVPGQEDDLKTILLHLCDTLLHSEDAIQAAICDIQHRLDSLAALEGAAGHVRTPNRARLLSQRDRPYFELVRKLRQLVERLLPSDALVIVISKGDDELVDFEDRAGWHFPQNDHGVYAGYYPADGAEAVNHLEILREKGGNYLLVPDFAFWWLDHYVELRHHLDSRYPRIWSDKHCLVYDLRKRPRLLRWWRQVVHHLTNTSASQRRDGARSGHERSARTIDRNPTPRASPQECLVTLASAEERPDTESLRAPLDLPSILPRLSRPRVTVVAWDVASNPLGRAYLIADMLADKFDVQLTGATFPRYGTDIWEPLRHASIPIKAFAGCQFPEHFHEMKRQVTNLACDAVVVSKPRLPSYELGILVKERYRCPLLLDIDDYELSFFEERKPFQFDAVINRDPDEDFFCPHGNLWTRYCDNIIPLADIVTTSNEMLQAKYGGCIVPHARHEALFDPALYDRTAIRAKHGFSPDDRIILFLGTPRPHKGLLEIAGALRALGNPRYKLCIIGSVDHRGFLKRLLSAGGDYLTIAPTSSFDELPHNVTIADLVCVLQDASREVSNYQMPAKFTDALAMEIPILASDVPPMRKLSKRGLVHLLGDAPLEERIEEIFAHYDDCKARARENRAVFLNEFSYEANRRRLETLVEEAMETPFSLPGEYARLIAHHDSLFS